MKRSFLCCLSGLLTFASLAGGREPIRFSTEILPILADSCLSCHGPDEAKRKAGLRLDTAEGALAERKEGRAIVPGQPELSRLLQRITSVNPDEAMPPGDSHKPRLTDGQVETIRRWITEGAVWGKHWAFEPPIRRTPPLGERHPIDAFIRARLKREPLTPSPEAPRHTLLRRLSFDLIGLPPTVEETEAFERDSSPDATLKVIDRLLDSPHLGERLAMWWLDAARYSDTDGFQQDAERTNWPWRDWVVKAFNDNLPFDQFTLEQFAGDLLPGSTPEQTLATGFHRNHMTNGEGGRDPEESRVDYVIDRVNTVGTTWLGLTLGCCQCHSHKFDPVSQADYYSLSAFFNSIDEDGKAGTAAKPYLAYQSAAAAGAVNEARRVVEFRQQAEQGARRAAEPAFSRWLGSRIAELRQKPTYSIWTPLDAARLESTEGSRLVRCPDGAVRAEGPNPNQDDYRFVTHVRLPRLTGLRLEVLPDPTHTGGRFSRGPSGEFLLTDIKLQARRPGSPQVRDLKLSSAVADYSADTKANDGYGNIKDTLDDDPRNGWTTKGATNLTTHVAVFALAEAAHLEPEEELIIELRHRSTRGDANIGRFRLTATDQLGEAVLRVQGAPLEELAQSGVGDATGIPSELRNRLFAQFLEDHAPYLNPKRELEAANRQLAELNKATGKLNVMVLAERAQPRETHVLVRGVWDKRGEQVEPGVPSAIAPWNPAEEKSRVGLARWITSKENPLTARVMVNHLWQLLFGAGLVRTPEDFGLQGERPVHPELLDWLAVEFRETGWDIKRLLRLIVTSATYQQDSTISPAALARDPENRWLARGARFRLPSWMIRDAGLQRAGLLNPALGGPPVRPYQPDGVWEELFMGRFTYQPSVGAAQYRRTVYAFWRRAIAPTFLFDTAQRRVCEVRNPRTNTPLQALALLNDENQLEAARATAARVLRSTTHAEERLHQLSRHILSRRCSSAELAVLERERGRADRHFTAHPDDAGRFLRRGQYEPEKGVAEVELAAHTVVASLLLNLDEAITHE